ncbi:MAG: hypothetical protein ACTSX9_04830 [Candidatus Njordarchaeales archaeon]
MDSKSIGEKIEYARRAFFGFLAGVILLVAKVHADLSGLLVVIRELVERGLLPPEIARAVVRFFFLIGLFGGLLVILGSLILVTRKASFLANFFISIGSGASLLDLISFMIFSAPTVKLILLRQYVENASSIGTNYILLTLGTVLAFLAMIRDTIGFSLGFIAGFLTNISSSLIESKILIAFLASFGILEPTPNTIRLLWVIIFSGNIVFLAGILHGIKKYKIGFALSLMGLMTYIPHLLIVFMGVSKGVVPEIIFTIAFIGFVFAVITTVYGAVKVVIGRSIKSK